MEEMFVFVEAALVIKMNIEYTEDGYLKLSVSQKGAMDRDELQKMNSNPYILPSFRDRYDKDIVLYHRGELISVATYFESNILQFEKLKKIVLQLTKAFLELEHAGFDISNIVTELDYLYINASTLEVKVIYCPVNVEINPLSFQKMLINICHGVETEKASILLGMLLEQSNKSDFLLKDFQQELQQLSNKVGVEVREVEKIVEVPVEVEKIVEKPVEVKKVIETVVEKKVPTSSGGIVCVVGILSVSLTSVVLPVILGNTLGKEISMEPKILNYALYIMEIFTLLIAYYLTRPKTEEDGRTVKPTQTIVTGMDSSTLKQKEVRGDIRTIKKEMEEPNPHVPNEVSQARVRRKSEDTMSISRKGVNSLSGEGTAVLFGEDCKSEAYLIEEGKTSLMDRIFIDKSEFSIGRDGGVSFRINEHAISKKHAEILYKKEKYYLKDLGSSNGTFLNNVRLEANKEEEISDGSRVTFGNKCYVFNRG